MIMEVGKIYTRKDLDMPSWVLQSRFHQFPLPTEVVITKPEFVVPLMARSYDLVLRTGRSEGCSKTFSWYIHEMWEDGGDDGHVYMYLHGYLLWPQLRTPNSDGIPQEKGGHYYGDYHPVSNPVSKPHAEWKRCKYLGQEIVVENAGAGKSQDIFVFPNKVKI